MKFIVDIVETLVRGVEVEASSVKDAEEQVRKMYDSEQIVLDSSDFVNAEFEVSAV